MRVLLCAVIAALAIGCGTVSDKPHEGELADTNQPVTDQSQTGGGDGKKPLQMPGGVGVTAGASGTGTTSGASTGN